MRRERSESENDDDKEEERKRARLTPTQSRFPVTQLPLCTPPNFDNQATILKNDFREGLLSSLFRNNCHWAMMIVNGEQLMRPPASLKDFVRWIEGASGSDLDCALETLCGILNSDASFDDWLMKAQGQLYLFLIENLIPEKHVQADGFPEHYFRVKNKNGINRIMVVHSFPFSPSTIADVTFQEWVPDRRLDRNFRVNFLDLNENENREVMVKKRREAWEDALRRVHYLAHCCSNSDKFKNYLLNFETKEGAEKAIIDAMNVSLLSGELSTMSTANFRVTDYKRVTREANGISHSVCVPVEWMTEMRVKVELLEGPIDLIFYAEISLDNPNQLVTADNGPPHLHVGYTLRPGSVPKKMNRLSGHMILNESSAIPGRNKENPIRYEDIHEGELVVRGNWMETGVWEGDEKGPMPSTSNC